MKTKCLKLLTWNVYIFYFLVCSVANGWARSTNQSSQGIQPYYQPPPPSQHRQTTLFRHERHNANGYGAPPEPQQHLKQRHPAQQQQQQITRRTTTAPLPQFRRREIHEAVHAFHPSNNFHLRHSLQNNYHPIRSHLTTISTTTKVPATPKTMMVTTRKSPSLMPLSAFTTYKYNNNNSHPNTNRYRFQHQQPQTQSGRSYPSVYNKVNQNIDPNTNNHHTTTINRGSFNKHSTMAPSRHSTVPTSLQSYAGDTWKTMGAENIFTTQQIRITTTVSPANNRRIDGMQLANLVSSKQPPFPVASSNGRTKNDGWNGAGASRRYDYLDRFDEKNDGNAWVANRSFVDATLYVDDGEFDDDVNGLKSAGDGVDDDDDDDDDNDDDDGNVDYEEDGGVGNDDDDDEIDSTKRGGTLTKLEDDIYDDNYLDDDGSVADGSLTAEKWRELGNPEAVEKYRQQPQRMSRNEIATHKANAHTSRMYSEMLCEKPRPKIIPIVAESSKTYAPHCTVLHRCGDDTGCCQRDALTCVPKRTVSVDLYFYVSTLGREPSVEYLTFINHTECHCVSRHRHHRLAHPPTSSPSSTGVAAGAEATLLDGFTSENTSVQGGHVNCTCVKHFEVFFDFDGDANATEREGGGGGGGDGMAVTESNDDGISSRGNQRGCRCDCQQGNTICEWLTRGKEGFTIEDRRCILDKRCTIPTCKHGHYSSQTGRCPSSEEKIAIARRHFG